jgi:LuxR family transcriptional regulator, quorum-sensing system regulator BjaR1
LITVQPSPSALTRARVIEIPERVSGTGLVTGTEWGDVSTLLEVGLMIRDFTGNIGYDKFLAVIYVPTARPENCMFALNGYPTRWLDIYRERQYIEWDPVFKRQWASLEPFEWSDLDPSELRHPRVEELFKDAMRHGLFGGLSFHSMGRFGAQLFMSFASSRYRTLGAQRDAVFGAALLLGCRALSASVHLAERDADAVMRRLSERQLMALQWAAQGLSMRQIATEMEVSPATVEYLIRQAQINVGARTREEAILHAAQMGLVTRHVKIHVSTCEA